MCFFPTASSQVHQSPPLHSQHLPLSLSLLLATKPTRAFTNQFVLVIDSDGSPKCPHLSMLYLSLRIQSTNCRHVLLIRDYYLEESICVSHNYFYKSELYRNWFHCKLPEAAFQRYLGA